MILHWSVLIILRKFLLKIQNVLYYGWEGIMRIQTYPLHKKLNMVCTRHTARMLLAYLAECVVAANLLGQDVGPCWAPSVPWAPEPWSYSGEGYTPPAGNSRPHGGGATPGSRSQRGQTGSRRLAGRPYSGHCVSWCRVHRRCCRGSSLLLHSWGGGGGGAEGEGSGEMVFTYINW